MSYDRGFWADLGDLLLLALFGLFMFGLYMLFMNHEKVANWLFGN